jgi:hypothetical protein
MTFIEHVILLAIDIASSFVLFGGAVATDGATEVKQVIILTFESIKPVRDHQDIF